MIIRILSLLSKTKAHSMSKKAARIQTDPSENVYVVRNVNKYVRANFTNLRTNRAYFEITRYSKFNSINIDLKY